MKENLKYINSILFTALFLTTSCYFSDPINEKPKCSFGVESDFQVKEKVVLFYSCRKDKDYIWEVVITPPDNSKYKESNLQNETTINRKSFIPDVPGRYIINFKITDKYGASDSETRNINIENSAPISIIKPLGTPKMYTVDKNLILDGSKSIDKDGKIVQYQWFFEELPDESEIVINNKNSSVINFIPDLSGVYTIALRVTDESYKSNISHYTFYVNENKAPEIKITYPDYKLNLISIKKSEKKRFIVKPTDDNTKYHKLIFNWSISINSSQFKEIYHGYDFLLNATQYSLGDLINLKLEIVDKNGLKSFVIWKIIIVK